MSGADLDPVALGEAVKQSGIAGAVATLLEGLVGTLPVSEEAKAALDAKIETGVQAILATYTPELLAALGSELKAATLRLALTGRSPVSDDQSGFA